MSCSSHTARTIAGALLLAGSLGFSSACSKQQPSEAPGSSARPMRSPDEAEAVFAEAEKELGSVLAKDAYAPPPAGGITPSAPAPSEAGHWQSREMGRCARACKALASMQRAANRLCELTGEGDDRCTDVRARVAAARAVVAKSCKRCDA